MIGAGKTNNWNLTLKQNPARAGFLFAEIPFWNEAEDEIYFIALKQKGAGMAATYFRAIALSSALEYFTSVFDMGTGGTTPA